MAELHGLLTNNHFGCCLGRSTLDSLNYVVKFVKDAWRKGQVVSALFLDIKSTFMSVILSQLVHDMWWRGVLEQYTRWIKMKVEGRQTTMHFDRYTLEARGLRRGIDQGCPLLGIIFQFYNTDLREIGVGEQGEDAAGFVDDMFLLAWGKTLEESNGKVKVMMEKEWGRMDWSCTHQCGFALDKFGVMGITRRRESNSARQPAMRPLVQKSISLQGIEILYVTAYKYLGVIFNQEFRWKDQVNYELMKGTKWVTQYQRL